MLSWDLYLNGAHIIDEMIDVLCLKNEYNNNYECFMNVLLFYKIKVSTYWALAHIVSCDADNESHEQ